MRDHFSQNDTALDLVDLPDRVSHETFNLELAHDIQCVAQSTLLEPGNGGLGFVQVALGDLQILLMRLDAERRVFLLLLFRSGFSAFVVLSFAHQPLEMPHIVWVLPPIAHLLPLAPPRRQRNDFAHRVIEQVDIGRIMHIGFNHKGIAPPTQRFVFFFLTTTWPALTIS